MFKINFYLCILFVFLVLVSCTPHNIIKQPNKNIKNINKNVYIDVVNYNDDVNYKGKFRLKKKIEDKLKIKLTKKGFKISENKNDALRLRVTIEKFPSSSPSLHNVPFSLPFVQDPDEGLLEYSAAYYEINGDLLSKFRDRLQYRGPDTTASSRVDRKIKERMNELPQFKGEQSIIKVFSEFATDRIIEFTLNGDI